MAKATKFYEDYARVVTPTSKNVVLEYKGESPASFTFNVDISGKNANKYLPSYENIPTRSGDDLIINTVFISNSGSAKTVTTTLKNYFAEPLLQKIEIQSNLLKNQTYIITQNTSVGEDGLYWEKGDFDSSDFILASKYDNEQPFELNNNCDDFVYDEKGKDNYVITSSSGTDYFLEMAGNDKYSASNASSPDIKDLKGNDEYEAKTPDTQMSIEDYSGNDEYIAQDFATIITHDYKGNDEYWLYSHEASYIQDNSGNDKYTFVNAWVTTGANIIENRYGNDKYDIEKSIAVLIGDYSGKDEYKIKNIDTSSSNEYVDANFIIVDYSGNDKYELENISSREEQTRSHISDELGNDSYLATNVNYVSFYDKKGNDKYNFISGKNATIYDWLGKDTYTLKGTETEKLKNLTINDMDTSKKTASDKYILEKTDNVTITDNAGNDKYTVNDSNYFEFLEHSGKDTYNLIGTEENKVSNFYITDYAGNDKYTLEHINKVHYEDQEPDKSSIVEKQGNDSYSIKETRNLIITDELGNDKYTLEEKHSNLSITDKSGKDTYKSKKGVFLSCTYIFDSGTDNDTYSLSGFSTGAIEDEGGNNKFYISDSYGFSIDAIGQGNDKYTLQNQINGYIKDYDGKDTYTSKGKTTLWELNITDFGTAADTYTLTGGNLLSITDEGGNNKFTISNCYDSGIKATGNGNDTYKYTNMSDCWIDDYDGNDNYNINKSWLSIIEDYAGSDVYKFTNTESGYITDKDGNDTYNLKNCYDIKITDESGDDSYSIDLTKTEGAKYYIEDWYSDDGDTLTIKGLSTKNIMYLSDYDNDGNATGDMIIFDKSSKSYIQIDSFFNYDTTFAGDFEDGLIETIKVGGKKLDIDAMEMSTYLHNISVQVGAWLSEKRYDDVCTLFDSGKEEDISNFIAYMTES